MAFGWLTWRRWWTRPWCHTRWPSFSACARHRTPDPLTPRQREVAGLIAKGLTNRQIAERLVVTERGAAAHVGQILDKLGASSRTQVAVWASEHGLLETRSDCRWRERGPLVDLPVSAAREQDCQFCR